MSGHIFVCYGRSDRWYVSELAAHLAELGVGGWWDNEGCDGGRRDESVIREAITASAGVVVVLTPRSVVSHSVLDEISHASDVQKPILPLLLELCPPNDLPRLITRLRLEDVTDGRMPGPTFSEQLLALVRPTTPGPAETASAPPTTAELVARYLPSASVAPLPPSRRLSTPVVLPWSGTTTLPASSAPPRRRSGVVRNAIVGVVAALGLVWMLVNQLPDVAGGSPGAPATPARSPAGAVNAFISAAEVRHNDAVQEHICQRYQGLAWYASDFYAPNFIQARLVLLTAGGDSATANLELTFQADRERRVKGVQYSVVTEGGAWKVCGPA